MAELKTKPTGSNVNAFIKSIGDEKKQESCFKIVQLVKDITKTEPKMWGSAIIGFGSYHYKYESGREGDICLIGFSPRKQNITLYLSGGFHQEKELLDKLGNYKAGKGCLYIQNLDDVDISILRKLIEKSITTLLVHIEEMKKKQKK